MTQFLELNAGIGGLNLDLRPTGHRTAPDEQAMLEMTATPAEATSRLSCQIELTPTLDGLQVRLPPTQY